MHWLNYLKKNLQKNKFFFFLFVLLWGFANVQAEELPIKCVLSSRQIEVEVYLPENVQKKIDKTLEKGLKTEIVFIIQLWEKRTGFFSFLGDIFLKETVVNYQLERDFLTRQYIVTDLKNNLNYKYNNFQEALNFFRHISLERIKLITQTKANGYYLKVKAKLFEYSLIPPLNFIYLFAQELIFESNWLILIFGKEN